MEGSQNREHVIPIAPPAGDPFQVPLEQKLIWDAVKPIGKWGSS